MATKANFEGRLSMLEQKYIELLERRVTELEARLTSGTTKEKVRNVVSTPNTAMFKEPKATTAAAETPGRSSEKKELSDEKDDDSESEKDKEDDRSKNKRYKLVVNQLDQETGEYIDKLLGGEAAAKKESGKKSDRAFTFRKLTKIQVIRGDETVRPTGSEVDIEWEPLQKLLAKVTAKYTGLGKVSEMSSPFQNLIWSWDVAKEEATKTESTDTDDDKQARVDLGKLMEIISTTPGDDALERYFKTKDSMAESRMVAFESLWTLFPRGSLIVSRPFLDQAQIFLVDYCLIQDTDEPTMPFTVRAHSYDWNGSTFNKVPYKFAIESFSDRKPIFELPFYPLSEYRQIGKSAEKGGSGSRDVEGLKAELINRGRKYHDYCTAAKGDQTFNYDGYTIHQQGPGLFRSESYNDDDESFSFRDFGRGNKTGSAKESKSILRGAVVIDFESYLQYHDGSTPLLGSLTPDEGVTACGCAECRESFEEIRKYSWDKKKKGQLLEEHLMMLPPRVLGYALAEKRWVQLHVDKVKKRGAANSGNFNEKLILSKENKELISKAVEAHGRTNITDYIPGKGKGLVILLWGVPGVGKTLTAESVASLAGKPLLSIGVADIGTQSDKVESNLQRIFALAGLWKAVLLFDEADVFLEARDTRGSVQRNTMVSVLLRVLEYYDGILILTTNRLKSFDIAVQSRIHIAIEYNDLAKENKEKIFNEFLEQLDKQGLVGNLGHCRRWVKDEGRTKSFNGRQIRNVVSTAMGVAHAENGMPEDELTQSHDECGLHLPGEKGKLCRHHLAQVSENTETFKKALVEQEAIFKNAQIRPHYGS